MKPQGYLLDTNILSNMIKQPQGKAAMRLRAIGSSNIFTSIIIAAELQFGIRKKGSDQLSQRVEDLLEAIEVLDFKPPADVHYGNIRHHLQSAGTPIGPNDLLIASHALAENLIVVTDNVNEFERVPELIVENWLVD